MIYINQHAKVASPYWRWRKYIIYDYSHLSVNIMPTRENYDTFKHPSKAT